jgi:hypothetical protein
VNATSVVDKGISNGPHVKPVVPESWSHNATVAPSVRARTCATPQLQFLLQPEKWVSAIGAAAGKVGVCDWRSHRRPARRSAFKSINA